jgi:NuA3 HAT complex component NTO1
VTVKSDFSDYRERKKLGKRILKAVQPQLEVALRLEAEANHRSFESLKQELEGAIEASLEYRPKAVATNGDVEGEKSQDVIMVDSSAAVIAANGLKLEDAGTGSGNVDVTMTDADHQGTSTDGNIDVDTSSPMAIDNAQGKDDMVMAAHSQATETKPDISVMNNDLDVNTPPETNGYNPMMPTSQPAPPTPPQSNSSLERQPSDTLTDGGVLWYLQGFEPEGTSAVQEEAEDTNAVRSQSEELTEIDDDELKGLGVEINEESITASPADTAPAVDGTNYASPTKKAPRPKKRKATTYRARR